MIAFLLVILVPAVLFFALIPVVLIGLMLESVKRPAAAAPALAMSTDMSIGDDTDFGFEEACVPSVA